MSPLVIFDARHGWINLGAISKFFTERQTTVSARPWNAFPNLDHVIERISQALIHQENLAAKEILIVVFVFSLLWLVVNLFRNEKTNKYDLSPKSVWDKVNSSKYSPYVLLAVWLGISLIGLGVYKQEIYAHYYGFIYAGVFLLIGGFVQILHSFQSKLWIVGSILLVGSIALWEFQSSPLRYPPNNQLERTVKVTDAMIEISGGQLFNIAVIAERNYEGAYQYFLEKENANFVIIDPQRTDETVADQLLVICELPKEKCDPVHNDKAEVANFGWSEVESEYEVAGVTIFKLIHSQ